MFKSIIYLRSYNDENIRYIYKLIDTDFECEVVSLAVYRGRLPVGAREVSSAVAMAAVVATISEYKKRSYSHKDIVRNLFRLLICDEYNFCFEKELDYQNKFIDICYKDINFSKLYYQELKNMWDKHKAFV